MTQGDRAFIKWSNGTLSQAPNLGSTLGKNVFYPPVLRWHPPNKETDMRRVDVQPEHHMHSYTVPRSSCHPLN